MKEIDVKIKTLGKALQVFDCFINDSQLGVIELSKRLNLNKSNVSDILATFREMEYLEQDSNTGKFMLGLKVLRFSQAISSKMGFHKYVYPRMQELANELGEVVYYGVPHGSNVIYLDGAFPTQALGNILVRSMTGAQAPLSCTGIGKAILCGLEPSQWPSSLPDELEQYTENTITDREELYAELVLSKIRGYSIDNMEHEYGIKCVGVPVYDKYDKLVAGLSASGPSLRFNNERIVEIATILKQVASSIQQFI